MNDKRKVIHIQDDGTKREIEFKYIKKGMKFKLFESTGEPVLFSEESIFTAQSDAYLNNFGIWEVETDI